MDTDVLSNDILDTIIRAFLSLEGVFNLLYPPEGSCLDLWQRVWPWIQFFDVYLARIPDAPAENIIRARFFSIIAYLSAVTATPDSPISATPGVGILAAQFWASYFHDPNSMSEKALQRLGSFLLMATRSGCDFGEYINGAGGVHALAKLLVQLLNYLLNWDHASRVGEVGSAVSFASIIGGYTWPPPSGANAWLSALQSHKYARALVSVLLLAENSAEAAWAKELLYKMAWDELSLMLKTSFSYVTIVDIVDAGFLQFIVSLPNTHGDIFTEMRGAIRSLIQPATIYYSVLASVEASLPLVAELTSRPSFISSALYTDWQELTSLVLERLKVKKGFDSGQYLSRKACDNLECGRILMKTAFKRCAACQYAHHCSRDCQIKDWNAGHRVKCENAAGHSDSLDGPTYLTSRDRAFVRTMLLDDYERRKQLVFLAWIVRMRQHGENLFTIFDYTKGRVGINVHPRPTPAANTPEPGFYASRSLESGRRMHLTILLLPDVMVPDGFKWILPIRSSDAGVHDALFRLSQAVPPGIDSVSNLSPEVRSIVTQLVEEACPHIVEIV
ncbi:hypothetical protein C8R45DRAFT_162035 [Mycena sanguinolenta]|nr:hypothetical protein C8R45DRAFT_162035 [Mycena sanguinolenta]